MVATSITLTFWEALKHLQEGKFVTANWNYRKLDEVTKFKIKEDGFLYVYNSLDYPRRFDVSLNELMNDYHDWKVFHLKKSDVFDSRTIFARPWGLCIKEAKCRGFKYLSFNGSVFEVGQQLDHDKRICYEYELIDDVGY